MLPMAPLCPYRNWSACLRDLCIAYYTTKKVNKNAEPDTIVHCKFIDKGVKP